LAVVSSYEMLQWGRALLSAETQATNENK